MMFTRYRSRSLGGVTLASLLLSWQIALAQDASLPKSLTADKDQTAAEGYIVLGKGPVHEAYARPYQKSPAPTPVVPRKPPAPITEEPPDQKPKGDNVLWIPGYWSWDLEKQDFIWVSGFWRVAPQGRQWLPGYWTTADGGSRWVPGYWAAAVQGTSQPVLAETDYLPDPPASLDYGPNVPAPDDNSIYQPGNWVYRSSRYLWQPGCWTAGYDDRVWNPSYYSWTPAGNVYVSGYWDYPLADRGLLFAPVYFNQPLYLNSDWYYRPSCVFGFGGLLSAIFCHPGWGSYYYGNYFSPYYGGLGFRPWCHYGWGGFGFDPLYNHSIWANRFNPGWSGGLRNDFLARRNGVLPVPANTLARQGAFAGPLQGNRIPQTVTPLGQFQSKNVQLASLNKGQLASQRAGAQQLTSLANQRARSETTAVSGARQGSRSALATMSGNPRAGQPGASTGSGQLRTSPQDGRAAASAGSQSGVPSQGRVLGSGSPGRNGPMINGQRLRSPAAQGGQGNLSMGSRSNRSAGPSPAARGVAPATRTPQTFQSAPIRNGGSQAHRGVAPSYPRPSSSNWRSSPSYARSSPSYARPSPSYSRQSPSYARSSSSYSRSSPSYSRSSSYSRPSSSSRGGHSSSHGGGGGHSGGGHGGGHHR